MFVHTAVKASGGRSLGVRRCQCGLAAVVPKATWRAGWVTGHGGRGAFVARGESTTVVTRRPAAAKRPAAGQLRMGVFGLGWAELAVVGFVMLLIWGPSRVSSLGRELGSMAGGLKKATSEFKDAMDKSLADAEEDTKRRTGQKVKELKEAPGDFRESFDDAMKRAEKTRSNGGG